MPNNPVYTLDVWELRIGRLIGTAREYRARRFGYSEPLNVCPDRITPGDSLRNHILGVFGELVAGKFLNRYFNPGRNTFDGGDYGEIEVKTCGNPHGTLKIPPRYTKYDNGRERITPPERKYLLVTPLYRWDGRINRPLRFVLPGWYYAAEAWEEYPGITRLGPLYEVPQNLLHHAQLIESGSYRDSLAALKEFLARKEGQCSDSSLPF